MRIALLALLTSLSCACAREKPSEIWLGGDIHVGATADAALDPLVPLFAGAPLIANVEGPVTVLTSGGTLSNAPSAIDALAPPLKLAGIANNHALDFGERGRIETMKELGSIGIPSIAVFPIGLQAGDARWVFTAHDIPAGGPRPFGLDADLREGRASAGANGIFIATFHATGPELYLPPPEIRDAVELAVLAGADVVAVHGSHVVGPVERRGKTVIAWGLGNLLFRCECTKQSEGMLLHLTKRGAALDAEIVPIQAGLLGKPARLAPDPDLTLDLIDSISPAPLVRSSLRDARTGRLPAHQAPEYQR